MPLAVREENRENGRECDGSVLCLYLNSNMILRIVTATGFTKRLESNL